MFSVDTLEFESLGNRGCLVGGPRTTVVIDPPRSGAGHSPGPVRPKGGQPAPRGPTRTSPLW